MSRAARAVAGLTVLAAVLRFATLDRQSFWSDEAITVLLTRMDLGRMLDTIGDTESTPPVYYVVAWVWTRVFGDGEIGLRSLSALAGVATVPVTYAAGRTLLGARAGIAAAALVTVSPPLVWYSQEARSYALAVLLCGLSFWAFARASEEPSGRLLALWAVPSVLAVGTHYFAGFVVLVEAAWLVSRHRSPAVWWALAGVAAGAAALLPLAVGQRGNGFAEFIGASGGLARRIVVVPKQLLVGEALPAERAFAVVVALLVVASLVLVTVRGTAGQRRAVLVSTTVGAAAFALPVALALVGFDYVNTRNALVGAVPLGVAAVAGLAVAVDRRAGAAALVALAGILGAVSVAVAADASYHRPNWRGMAQELGPPSVPRAILAAPDHQGWFARVPLQLYLPDAHAVDRGIVRAGEQFATVARRSVDRSSPRTVEIGEIVTAGVGWEAPSLPAGLAGRFALAEERSGDGWTFRRYRSDRPVDVRTTLLAVPLAAVLVEERARP